MPYNPLKLKNPRRDTALLAFAGPLANFSVALIFGLIIRAIMITSSFVPLLPFLVIIVQVNLILGVFNLMPIPPLDGSKILFYFFPSSKLEMFLSQYGLIVFFFFILFASDIILSLVSIFSLFQVLLWVKETYK